MAIALRDGPAATGELHLATRFPLRKEIQFSYRKKTRDELTRAGSHRSTFGVRGFTSARRGRLRPGIVRTDIEGAEKNMKIKVVCLASVCAVNLLAGATGAQAQDSASTAGT